MGAIAAAAADVVEKGLVVSVPQQLLAHRGQHVVGIVMTNVERQITIDAFHRARFEKRARSAGADAVIERLGG